MPAPKPSTVADWDTSLANLLMPSGGQIASGWTVDQVPPSDWFNWWMNLVGQWTDYLRDFELIAHTWAPLQLFGAVGGNAGAIFAGSATGQGLSCAAVPGAPGAQFLGSSAGDSAIVAVDQGGNTDTIRSTGTGSGAGLKGTGGPTGAGVHGVGGTSGPGVQADTNANRGGLNILPAAAPASPSNGDAWVDTGDNSFDVEVNGGVLKLLPQAAPQNVGGYLGTWASTGYAKLWKDSDGVVHAVGQIGPGASPQAQAFTLPAALRPAVDVGGTIPGIPGLAQHASALYPVSFSIVAATGVVSINPGTGTSIATGDVISLNGLSWPTNI